MAARRMLALVLLALLPVGHGARAGQPAAATGDVAAALATCAGCHGARGEGQGDVPRLAGLDAGYLARQLEDFASGRRASPVMQPIAAALSPAAREAVARRHAALPLPMATVAADPRGERLALRGAWDRGIPACVQCHGPRGVGVGAAFPGLAGQRAGYLVTQLEAFRAGRRRNDPQALMRAAARGLSDAEIRAVAGWFAAQSQTTGARR
jgi:cytochrome c553